MEDIIRSLNRALVDQGWIYGDRAHRIGNPFEAIDFPTLYRSLSGILAFTHFLAMFYEKYPTPEEILTSDYERMKAHYEDQLLKAFKHFVPFLHLSSPHVSLLPD
mgnify:CR=1 FL=1